MEVGAILGVRNSDERAWFPRGRRTTLLVIGFLGLLGLGGCAAQPALTWMPEGVPHSDRPFAQDSSEFHFAIVADRTGGHRPGVFPRALEQLNRLRPELVLSVGDLIEGYSEDEAKLAAEWDEIEGFVDRLDMPFFYTVGNHDMGNDVMLETWRARRGREYWAFVHRDVLFLSLSSEDPPIALSPDIVARQARFERLMNEDPEAVERMLAARASEGPPKELPSPIAIGEEQIRFVEATLAAHRDVSWTVVLMHKPAWKQESPAFARIEAMLADRPYSVLAGHEHYYEHTVRRGRDYFVLGTTGGVWLSRGPGAFDHVMWVTMTQEGPTFAPIRLDGLLGVDGLETTAP